MAREQSYDRIDWHVNCSNGPGPVKSAFPIVDGFIPRIKTYDPDSKLLQFLSDDTGEKIIRHGRFTAYATRSRYTGHKYKQLDQTWLLSTTMQVEDLVLAKMLMSRIFGQEIDSLEHEQSGVKITCTRFRDMWNLTRIEEITLDKRAISGLVSRYSHVGMRLNRVPIERPKKTIPQKDKNRYDDLIISLKIPIEELPAFRSFCRDIPDINTKSWLESKIIQWETYKKSRSWKPAKKVDSISDFYSKAEMALLNEYEKTLVLKAIQGETLTSEQYQEIENARARFAIFAHHRLPGSNSKQPRANVSQINVVNLRSNLKNNLTLNSRRSNVKQLTDTELSDRLKETEKKTEVIGPAFMML